MQTNNVDFLKRKYTKSGNTMYYLTIQIRKFPNKENLIADK